MQFVREANVCARHWSWIAKARAGVFVDAGTSPGRDPRQHGRPDWRPIPERGFEYDRGRTSAHADKIQPGAIAGGDESSGMRIDRVPRNRARHAWKGRTYSDAGNENRGSVHSYCLSSLALLRGFLQLRFIFISQSLIRCSRILIVPDG